MARFCWKCGSAVSEGAKFCRACGTTLPLKNVPRQPIQSNDQPPIQTQTINKPKNTPVKKKKGKGIIVAAIISSVVVMLGAFAVVGVLGFREGGWFRKKDDSNGRPAVSGYEDIMDADRGDAYGDPGSNTAVMLDYAKRLEEMGNMEAAAEIYA